MRPRDSYLALLLVGLAVPALLPALRWALTPPFHPDPKCRKRRKGGLFSVALSLGLLRPGVTRHRRFMESGLSSRRLPDPRPSGHPRMGDLGAGGPPVNGEARGQFAGKGGINAVRGAMMMRAVAQAKGRQPRGVIAFRRIAKSV